MGVAIVSPSSFFNLATNRIENLKDINYNSNWINISSLLSIFSHAQWSWQTILMGFCFLVLLLVARHVVRLLL